ncbi:cation:proton antiporter, partial [Bullifex porci]
MDTILITLAFALIAGLMMSRLAKLVNLPAVTAYLIAGLIIGPFCLGKLGVDGLGFTSLAQVGTLEIISQTALGFIAFAIGNEFRLKDLKVMGRAAITVGILQAVITTLVVDIALVTLHFIFPSIISISSAITLGAIAAATAPAATLMVVRQYKAEGPLTKLLLMVVAIDDAVGLVLFSVSFGIATALETGAISIITVLVEPLIEIGVSVLLGVAAGLLLNWLEVYFHSRSKRLALAVAFVLLTVGISQKTFV